MVAKMQGGIRGTVCIGRQGNFVDNRNVRKILSVAVAIRQYTIVKTRWIVLLKLVNFIRSKLYHNKDGKK